MSGATCISTVAVIWQTRRFLEAGCVSVMLQGVYRAEGKLQFAFLKGSLRCEAKRCAEPDAKRKGSLSLLHALEPK